MIKRLRTYTSPLRRLAAPLTLVMAAGLSPSVSAHWSAPTDPTLATWTPISGLPLSMWSTGHNRIDGLAVTELDDGSTVLTLQGSKKPTFNVYRLEDPDRLVVDLSGSERGQVVPHVPLDTWACGRVSLDPVSERDTKLVRMVIELKRESSYIVVPKGENLVVTITPREVAPEAYFAHKSADKRRQEIEASARTVDKAKRDAVAARRDAHALKAEAKALSSSARDKEAAAKQRAAAADNKAASARKAEAAARAAEKRAKKAEAEAAAALSDAKTNKFRARRTLAKAKAERENAEKARAEAVAARTSAEAKAKAAESALQKRKAQLAEAERLLAAAKADAEATTQRAKKTEAVAEHKLAQAQTTLDSAKSKLDSAKSELSKAKAAAKKAETEASDRLRKAEAKAAAADKAATEARLGAKRRLAKAAKAAQQELARAQTTAKAKETAAAKALADAKKAKAEANRALADAKTQANVALANAKAKAKVEADKLLAAARKDASATRSSAAALEAEAKKSLSRANTAVKEAQSERDAATKAKAEADAALALAKKELDAAKVAGKRKRRLQRKLDRAQTRRTAAAARKSSAERALAKLRKDRSSLQAKLGKQQKLSKQLEGKIAREKSELAALKTKVAKAKAKLSSSQQRPPAAAKRSGPVKPSPELLAARKQAATTQGKLSKLSKEVSSLRAHAKSANARAESAERRVAELKEQGARRRAVNQAKDEASELQAAASKARASLEAHASKLDDLEASLKRKKAAVAKAQARQRELEKKAALLAAKNGALSAENGELAAKNGELAAKNGSLSAKNGSLSAKNGALSQKNGALSAEYGALSKKSDAARAELERAEAELAKVRSSLKAKKSKLASLHEGVRDAKAELESQMAPEPAPAPTPVAATGASKIKDVRFEDSADESRVIIEVDGPMAFEGKTLTPTIKMLELRDTAIAQKLERSLDASAYKGPISMVTSFAEGDRTKVIVSTNGSTSAKLEEKPGKLVWHFPRTSVGKSEVVSLAGSKVGGYAAAPGKPPLATTLATTAAAPAPATGRDDGGTDPVRSGRRRWRGERIDIELQEAPIKDVLLLFSDIGRVNIIAGRGVEGSVTMKLTSVPWDQALDIILRSLQLGMQRDGNVIRVATLEDLESERQDAIQRANAQVQLKPLETRLRSVSYATVDEMIPKVQSVLSPRGSVTPDSRTNKLIIMDVAENIALAEQLIASLDTQTPQVLIEARIVEARTTFQRQLGIQWGFDFTASPGTGNPTGLLFPNSLGVAGGATGTPVDTRGLVLPGAAANPNYAVDLPAPVGTGSGGALGFSFGSISGNLNTNLRLSAAESTGEVRIISAPKVVTLDNSQAQIEQGVQIPISQVSAQGVNTRFVNATLSLQVTPHVTNEGSVLLDVQVQKNEADFVNTGARGDPTILTRSARSRMLVNDADTAVIGGIYTRNKAVNYTKVPWLADIPIIGWFFKSKSEADTRSEVLIFLTPRIVNRASSIGG